MAALTASLASTDPGVQASAAKAIGELLRWQSGADCVLAAGSVAGLVDALNATDWGVVAMAATAIGKAAEHERLRDQLVSAAAVVVLLQALRRASLESVAAREASTVLWHNAIAALCALCEAEPARLAFAEAAGFDLLIPALADPDRASGAAAVLRVLAGDAAIRAASGREPLLRALCATLSGSGTRLACACALLSLRGEPATRETIAFMEEAFPGSFGSRSDTEEYGLLVDRKAAAVELVRRGDITREIPLAGRIEMTRQQAGPDPGEKGQKKLRPTKPEISAEQAAIQAARYARMKELDARLAQHSMRQLDAALTTLKIRGAEETVGAHDDSTP